MIRIVDEKTQIMYEKIKKNEAVEPTLLFCKISDDVKPGSIYGPVIRDVFVIECHTEGCGTLIINDNKFELKPGDCYALYPGHRVVLTSDMDSPRKDVFCIVGGTRVGQLLKEAGVSDTNPFAHPDVCPYIKDIIYKIIEMKEELGREADIRRTAYIYEILAAFMRGKNTNSKHAWVEKAMAIFELGYQDDLSVDDVATNVGFDRCYFSLIFKEVMGVSPHKYLTSLRIDKACKLLLETNARISEISESVGIDPSNFARTFKAEMGMSPMQYKKQHSKI